ncbi:exonuclease [Neorhizobium sp. R1-B]|uniref:3'-5' exonuclease n=1 Tax=Neorhizobium sp. R1-B TaxID=2485162 RepID=UPI0010671667|nr:3'-5' exonuclease [Neorhizobium sp. R1-B]TDX79632.1 exonuclease [Neorhizobium sp. R1-B]
MKTAIIFDCEFLCIKGSQSRFWCAAVDPDPVIAQIGAVKIGLEEDFPILETFKAYVTPRDRHGARYAIDPYFTDLTGITVEQITRDGRPLQTALDDLDRFSDGATFWSWGKDELNMIAISCYVEGIKPPIPAPRFDNAVKLLVAAGMPVEDLARTPSNKLADYYGVEHPDLQAHDALDDARSVAYTLQHLLTTAKLQPSAFGS